MTKRNTKRALLLSALSLLLCVSMLVGSTFAWFTDSVTSSGNIIKSGTLDVTMEWKDATATGKQLTYKDASQGAIFNYDKWEPGYVEAKNIKIGNAGTLALKYQLNILATGAVSELANVIDVYYAEGEYTLADREMSELTLIGNLKTVLAGLSTTASGDLLEGESDTVTLALKMQETAGNQYQDLAIGSEFAVQLMATQLTAEDDSFDNQYDVDAPKTEVATAAELQKVLNEGGHAVLAADIATEGNKRIDIPAGTQAVLDLNGYTLTSKDGGGSNTMAIYIDKGAVLTLDDSVGGGEIVSSCYGVYVKQNAKFIMNGGTLNVSGNGVYDIGVSVWNADFVMNGGTINSKFGVWASNYYRDAGETGLNTCYVKIADGCVLNSTGYADVEYADALDAVIDVPADVTLYPVNVSSADELENALANGGNVVLVNDIDLAVNTTITVGNGVESTLNLNGYTLSGQSTKTATNNFMIDVKGGTLNVSNGTVAMKHTGSNMAWSGAATVIDVTAGGVLNLDGVTVKNEGGTDMNFAVHLNNWGDVTLNANDCVFEATYCSVRVFNSGPQMNNVKITNSTMTGNKMAFWVHNYASSDFGGKVYSGASAAYDKDAVDARLNFDIYGNGNTFNVAVNEYPAPIRYGFNESVYYDANGNLIP